MATPTLQPRSYVCLTPRTRNQIPFHPTLGNDPAVSPNLRNFCDNVHREGRRLIGTEIGERKWFEGHPKNSLPCTRSTSEYHKEETWYAKSSTHTRDELAWDDFETGLLQDRSRIGYHYTPDIYDRQFICSWPVQDPTLEASDDGRSAVTGESPASDVATDADSITPNLNLTQLQALEAAEKKAPEQVANMMPPGFTLQIYEMAYRGFDKGIVPFRNRVFPVLVLTKSNFEAEGPHEVSRSFLMIQIPLDLTDVPAAYYSNSKHRSLHVANKEQKREVVIGRYASVEHCYQLPGSFNMTHWDKALAIDLRGQAKGSRTILLEHVVPRLLCENVDSFIQWSRDGRVERPLLPVLVRNPPTSEEAAKDRGTGFEETELIETNRGTKRKADGTTERDTKAKIKKAIGCKIL